MATYYFTGNISNNWGTAGNWSTVSGGTGDGAVPTSADDAVFNASSPNCTVDTTGRVCKTLNFTGYTNTITMTNTITVSGDVTLAAAMGIAGTSALIVNATATLTSNTKQWNLPFYLQSPSGTYTLSDDWYVSDLDLGTSAGLITLNGFKLYFSGNIIAAGNPSNGSTGTTEIVANGTGGFLSNRTRFYNPFTISTSGTFSFNSYSITFANTFKYTAGTVDFGTSTLIFTYYTSTAYNVTFPSNDANNVTFGNTSVCTITLLSNISVNNTLQLSVSNNNFSTINGFTIYAKGNITVPTTNGGSQGTTNIEVTGTASQTWTSSGSAIKNNLTINKSGGSLTISGTVYYNTGTLTYTSGTVTTTGSTLTIATNTTLDTDRGVGGKITWNNITVNTTSTITLSSNFTIGGNYTHSNGAITYNGANVYLGGNITMTNGNIANGTATLIYNGTGTWSGNAVIQEDFTINTTGTLTISGNVSYNTSTLTYTAGTVTTTGSTLTITGNTTLNTNGDSSSSATTVSSTGINWNNVTVSSVRPLTLTSNMRVCGDFLITDSLDSINTSNGSKCYIKGSLTTNYGSAYIQFNGTAEVILDGTGSFGSTSAQMIRITQPITINTSGTITLVGSIGLYGANSMNYTAGTINAGTSLVYVSYNSTLNYPGINFYNLQLDRSWTHTLSSDITVTENLYLGSNGSSNITINGAFTIYVNKNINIQSTGSGSSGTATIELNTTTSGIWSSSGGAVGNNMIVNKSSGTLTISGSVAYNTGTLTYTSGTVTTTGSTLTIAANTTLDTDRGGGNKITWNNITSIGNSTFTLLSDLNVGGLFNINNQPLVFNGTYNVNLSGGLTLNQYIAQGTGTTTINLSGGTWNATASNGVVRTNLSISGNITIGTNVYYSTGTLTYTSGTVTTTSSTLNITATTTLNTNGISWNNVTISGTPTITLLSNWDVNGRYLTSVTTTVNGFTLYLGGDIQLNTNTPHSGTTNIIYDGTGTWNTASGAMIYNNFTINTSGTLTLGTATAYGSGTFTYTAGTVITTGNTMSFVLSCTLNTNGITWNNITYSGTNTTTLLSDLTVNGTLTIAATTWSGAYSIYCNGNVSNTSNCFKSGGFLGLFLTGTGTLSCNSTTTYIECDVTINTSGTITFGTYVTIAGCIFTYTSGTVVTTSSTFTTGLANTLDTDRGGGNKITFNNITFTTGGGTINITLLSDLSLSGLLTISGITTINGTYNINASAGITVSANLLQGTGTTTLNITGGTWTSPNNSDIRLNININGNVTISGSVSYSNGTLTYLSGSIITGGSTLTISNTCTLDTDRGNGNNIIWNNITRSLGIITLLSDLTVNGLLTISGTINGTFNIYSNNGITMNGSLAQGTGTTTLYLTGGTWSTTGLSYELRLKTFIQGNITINGTIYYGLGTLTYNFGNVKGINNPILIISQSTTLININRLNVFRTITVTAGITLTMNKFFEGNAKRPCRVQSSTSTGTYTVTFQDGMEKISNNTRISGCIVTNPGQLLITNSQGNKGNNRGVRYINSVPNGTEKYQSNTMVPQETQPYGYGTSMLSDPSMISTL